MACLTYFGFAGLWCGNEHTTVSSRTNGYFEMKLAFCCLFVVFWLFCGNFWLFKNVFRDKGWTCLLLPKAEIVFFWKKQSFGWLFRRFFQDKGWTSLLLRWAENFFWDILSGTISKSKTLSKSYHLLFWLSQWKWQCLSPKGGYISGFQWLYLDRF